jgi:hypothetical protein
MALVLAVVTRNRDCHHTGKYQEGRTPAVACFMKMIWVQTDSKSTLSSDGAQPKRITHT